MALRTLHRRVILVTAIVAVALMLVIAIAHLPPVRARVLDQVRAYAARELGVAIDAQSLHYNLFGPSAELRGVTVASLDDKDQRALLHADGVRVVLGRGLILGQVDIRQIELDRPRLTVVRHADGTLNLPRGRGEASTEVTPLRLGVVQFRQLTIGIDDEMSGRAFAMGPIDLSIDTSASSASNAPGAGGADAAGAFGPSPFSIRLEAETPGAQPRTLSGTVGGRLAFDGSRVIVPALTIETPEGQLAFDGSLDAIARDPKIDVRSKVRIDLARAARLAGLDRDGVQGTGGERAGVERAAGERGSLGLSGTLDVTGSATGSLSAPAVRLGVRGQGLAIRSVRDITLAADAELVDGGRLKVSALDLLSPLGVVHASGDIVLVDGGAAAGDRAAGAGDDGAASRLRVRWTDVDLDAAARTLGYELPARLGSKGSGTADLSVPGSVAAADALSSLDAAVSSELRPVGGGLALEGAIDANVKRGAWSLGHRLSSAPAGASLEGTFTGRLDTRSAATVSAPTVTDSTIGGGTRLRIDDVGAVYAFARDAGIALPELPAALADLRGRLDAAVRAGGTVSRPTAQATITARDVHAGGIVPGAKDIPGAADATLTATRDALRIQSLAMTLGPSRVEAAGSYTWAGQTDITFDARADDLSALARMFEPPASPNATVPASADAATSLSGMVAGSARLTGRAQGDIASPQVDAKLDARNLIVDGLDVGAANATLSLANNRLRAEASAPALSVVARADVDAVEPYRYNAEARLDNARIAALVPPRLLDGVAMSEGIVTGTLRASGTAQQPLPASADVSLERLDAVVNDTRIVLESPAVIAWTPARLAVRNLGLRIGQSARVQLAGSLGAEPLPSSADRLRLTAGSPLSELIALVGPLLPADTRLAADGTLAADLQIGGTLNAPKPEGTLTVRAASVRYGDGEGVPPVTDVVIDARVDPTQILLRPARAAWQQSMLTAEGTIPWRLIARALTPAAANGAAAGATAGPAAGPAANTTANTNANSATNNAANSDAKSDLEIWLDRWVASLPPEPANASLTARVTGITPKVLAPFVSAEQLREINGAMALTITANSDALSLDRARASMVLDEASLTLAGVPFKQLAPSKLRIENGRAIVDEFRWDSLGNPIAVSGSAEIAGAKPLLDLRVDGAIDLRALAAFATGIGASGTARANLAIGGALAAPDIVGEIVVADADLRVDSPRLVFSEVGGSIRIGKQAGTVSGTGTAKGSGKDHAAVINLTGTINGGTAKVDGVVDLTQPADPRGSITLAAQDVVFEYPDGLRTESNLRLTLALTAKEPTLTGRIDVLGGTYREPIVLTSHLLDGLAAQGLAAAADAPSFLSTLRLDMTLATREGIRIDNNYGRLEVAGTLRITGTPERPGVIGRLEAAPDGEVFLAGNTYRVERLVLDFADPRAIVPDVSFLAQTRLGRTPVEIELSCPATGPCERTVKSLSAEYTDAEMEAQLFGLPSDATAAGEQLARLLSGEVLGVVSRTVRVDTLRLEQGTSGASDIFDDPTLMAGDVDPAARLTVGKRLGNRVELAYSQNLTDSGFTWSTAWRGPYGMFVRALLLDDQSRAYEFRHEPRFGESRSSRPPRQPGPRITDVRIDGAPGFPERDVRRRLRLGRGDRFQFAAWQRDRERLEDLYLSRGYYEARIRARRIESAPESGAESDAGIILDYRIDRGPETRLDVRGVVLPDDVRERIVQRWSAALFDTFLERDAATIVRDHLAREGYLAPTITAKVRQDAGTNVNADANANASAVDGVKILDLEIDRGSMIPGRLEFKGNDALTSARLSEAARAIGTLNAWLDATSFARAIQSVYRDEGFLAAEVQVAPPEVARGASIVLVTVREGSRFLVGDVTLKSSASGDAAPPQALRDALGISPEMPYGPAAVVEALGRVDVHMRQAGFLGSRTTVDAVIRKEAARVDLRVTVDAGPRSILRDVIVEGADAKKPIVARAIALTPGAPVDPRAVGETRRLFYDSGVYRAVEIDLQPVADAAVPPADAAAAPSQATPAGAAPPAAPAQAAAPQAATPQSPSLAEAATQMVDARIQLLERPRYRLRYGFAFTDYVVAPDVRDRRSGLAADFERRNLFGGAANAGVAARLRRDQQVGRVFVGANRFIGMPLRSTVFVERSREEINPEGASPIIATVTDFSAEQSYSIRRRMEVRYGYSFGRNRTVDESLGFDLSVRAARLTTSALVDRRSDPFDPTSGWFASSNIELSRPSLGSDLSFLKGFVQFYQFTPVRRGVVVASAVRIGLARTYDDQELYVRERFFAGGATSVRGYRQDDLGVRSSLGDAAGGMGLLVINEELRFPIFRWLRGVGFLDLGNVYETVGDISLGDLQVGVGAGARLDTPVGLFRVDLGIPANSRTADPKWKIYFGLGHTF